MRLHREASIGIGAILALQILLSMLGIALLTRMGPAVEQILKENVFSGEAVEDMLAAVATTPAGEEVPPHFVAALERARWCGHAHRVHINRVLEWPLRCVP